jgi:hypothetical protein
MLRFPAALFMTPFKLFLILLPFGLAVVGFLILCAARHYRVWQAHIVRHEIINDTWKEEMEIFNAFRTKGIDFSYSQFRRFMRRMVDFKKVEVDITVSLVDHQTLHHHWYRFNKKRPGTSASHSTALYS